MSLKCPVCGSGEFKVYNDRENALCVKCGALERGRLAWMVLQALDMLRPDVKLLNIAPEPFMLFHGAEAIGQGYMAVDYDPELFAKWRKTIIKLDLCNDLAGMEPGQFDVIMHNHVLEHVGCDVTGVLANLNRLLVPGGVHLFSAPIMPDRSTEEDMDPALTPLERRRRFGQEDHLRIFGDRDFMDILARAMPTEHQVDLVPLIDPARLTQAALPADVLVSLNPHRVFVWRKDPSAPIPPP